MYLDFGLRFNRVALINAGNGQIKGDIHGVTASSAIQKLWLSSQAFGDIAFSFNYNIILLNIQVRRPF